MSYTIIITETRVVEEPAGKEWGKLGEREVERDEPFQRHDPKAPRTRIEPVMGYTPEIIKKTAESVEVLKQTVEVLDIPAVIKAINNL